MDRRRHERTDVDRSVVDAAQDGEEFETEPLGKLERMGATVLGVAGVGGGGWAVFATDNQAGSAALLLVGAAFLLMGVQGTPLIRLGTAENGVELARRRRRVARAIEQAQQEDDPAVAAGIVEAAAIIEPELLSSPTFRAQLFDSRVALALNEAGFLVTQNNVDFGPDFMVRTPTGGVADVHVKYRERGPLTMKDIGRVESYGPNRLVGALLVTNAPLSPEAEAYNADQNHRLIEAITFRDERDRHHLARALMRVMAAGSREPQG